MAADVAAFRLAAGTFPTGIVVVSTSLDGNGHAMMLERNNAEIAALITDWIVKHT